MALSFYNTLTRSTDVFTPLTSGSVKMYNCGPTVYNYAHIGNFRAYICSDILKRYLLFKGFSVYQVMNITDVDDKTIRDSQTEGMSLQDFTKRYTDAFFEDLKTLSISNADEFPRATTYIDDMILFIHKLLEKGFAYKASDGIYFNIKSFMDYGKFARVNVAKAKQSARNNNDEYDKERVHDFALWKFWDPRDGDVFWETDLGKGRPGWHLECSVMSMALLGEQFDIHTGGVDLIFPHHQNEIAQSEAVTGKQFVRYWLHNEYIMVDGKKMSKSLGNFYTLRDLLDKGYNPRAIRYLLLSAHYRQQLNFTLKGIESAQSSIDRLQEFVDKLKDVKNGDDNPIIADCIDRTKQLFEVAMDDDLNISEALSHIFEFVKEINVMISDHKVSESNAHDCISFMKEIDSIISVLDFSDSQLPENVAELVDKRKNARKNKDWVLSDSLRDEIKALGYHVLDTPDGQRVKKL